MSTKTVEKRDIKIKRPQRYCNIFHNNNVTTQETVVNVLYHVFHFSGQKAIDIMLQVHEKGKGIVFIGSKEVCDLKKEMVNDCLRKLGDEALVHEVSLYENDDD